ncbi:hypothetical protein N510_001077 [Firmicutes bacterium ASF500]|nr:hypothetical protein N510_001077 [Firmicutes bacterium ASF500]
MAAGDKIGAAQARKRSAALGREYRSFCEKAGLTPRPERTRSMTGPTVGKAKPLAKIPKNDILRSTDGDDIPVTEAAIQRVPRIRPTGWSEERCLKLEEAHKELLRFVKDAPVGTEALAVYTEDMGLVNRILGEDGQVRFRSTSSPHIVVHNHPNGLTFSAEDIRSFIWNYDMTTLTAVGNNGTVYAMHKTDGYLGADFLKAFIPIISLYEEAETEAERSKIISRFLEEGSKYGVQFISRG